MTGMEKAMKVVLVGWLVLLVSATGALAAEVPDQGRKGAWTWKQNVARTVIGRGVELMVVFTDDLDCDTAMLMIGGNTNITALALTVDGEYYG
jgi:hypothetical protein